MTDKRVPREPTLLPCPFCGRRPDVEPWHGGAPTKVRISCPAEYVDECAVVPSVTGETATQAASRWNTRPAPDADAGRVADPDRVQKTVVALRTPDPSISRVPNTVRQAMADVIEEQRDNLTAAQERIAELERRIQQARIDIDAIIAKIESDGGITIEAGSGRAILLGRVRALLRGDDA